MERRQLIAEGYQAWVKPQKSSLVVILRNGPFYDPNLDVRFPRHAQFYSNPEFNVQQRSWLVAPFGTISGTPQDVQRIGQAKVFQDYQTFPQAQGISPRAVTDYFQGNADIFKGQDTYGWPPPPVPEYWSPSMLGSFVVRNSFAAYPFANDVFLLKDQDKTIIPYLEYFTGQKAIPRSLDTYIIYLDPTRFKGQDKTMLPPEIFWRITNVGTRNVLDSFLAYNPSTDISYRHYQDKTFVPYQEYFTPQRITGNILNFLAPPYDFTTDLSYRPRAQPTFIPYDDSQWNVGFKPYQIVISGTGVLPPAGFSVQFPPEGGRVILPPKKLGEDAFIPMNFLSKLQQGEVILSAVVTCTLYSGTDPNPGLMISGGATVNGSIVTQMIQGGVLGNIYDLLYKVTTSLGQILELSGYLVVSPDIA